MKKESKLGYVTVAYTSNGTFRAFIKGDPEQGDFGITVGGSEWLKGKGEKYKFIIRKKMLGLANRIMEQAVNVERTLLTVDSNTTTPATIWWETPVIDKIPHSCNAQDIVDIERDEMGNEIQVIDDGDLTQYEGCDLEWLYDTEAHAQAMISTYKIARGFYPKAREIRNAIVLAKDLSGGHLLYICKDEQ